MSDHDTHPIRQARTARNLTLEELGRRVGVTKASVSKWERGEAFPEPRIAFRISKSLKLPLELVYASARDAA